MQEANPDFVESTPNGGAKKEVRDRYLLVLSLSALGVVYGDIGTSPLWRERFFAWISRNALPATDYFCLPTRRVVELGTQIEL
jgi:K+ transporter